MTVPALADDGDLRPQTLFEYEPGDGAGGRPSRARARLRVVRGLELVPPPVRPAVPPAALGLMLRQVMEVLDGRRPVGQLRSLVPEQAVQDLMKRVAPGGQHTVRSLHACFPTATAVEVAATVHYRSPAGRRRVLATAARFERERDRWVCRVLRML